MTMLFINPELLKKLYSGEILFTDLDGYELEGFEPKEDEIMIPRIGKLPIPQEIRWTVLERDNFTCKHCNSRRFLAIDHIKPESKGGEATLDNLQTLCKKCNSSKGTKWQNEDTSTPSSGQTTSSSN
jgi:hypothetical protein